LFPSDDAFAFAMTSYEAASYVLENNIPLERLWADGLAVTSTLPTDPSAPPSATMGPNDVITIVDPSLETDLTSVYCNLHVNAPIVIDPYDPYDPFAPYDPYAPGVPGYDPYNPYTPVDPGYDPSAPTYTYNPFVPMYTPQP